MNFYFLYPKFLYLLLAIPFLVALYFISVGVGKKRAINFSNFEALERISGIEFFSKSFFVLFLDIFLIVCLVFAMAQLQVSYFARTDSFSHVVLIDNSGSMDVRDVGVSRLELAKSVAKRFVDEMPEGVEFGVVSFAGDSKIIKRLDSSALKTKSALDSVERSGIEGTNVLNAFVTADSLFSEQKKAILLISDGQFSLNNLSDLVEYSEENNIVINSVLVGTSDGGRDEFGVLHRSNSEVLKALAFNSGGRFFEVSSSDIPKEFKEVFLESEREISLDLTLYLLILALILFFVGWTLNNFRIFVF